MKKITIILMILLLTGCEITGEIVKEVIPTEEGNIEVRFCPKVNCSERFVEIAQNGDVKCAFYDLNLEEIRENVDELVVHERSYGLMHNKFCVINESIVWTGSMNPTYNGNYKNNNNVVIIESHFLAENYLEEFEELEQGIYGKGEKVLFPYVKFNGKRIENYFCPEDDCEDRILKELDKAEKSIHFMTFSFTSNEIASKLVEKSKQIEVTGVMEAKRKNMQYNKFKELSVEFDVFLDTNPATMHHKVFVVDERVVITGSMNPSKSGDERNDENILIIEDAEIAQKYMEEFNSLVSEESQ